MLAAALLFISGAGALIYQVLWIKQLSVVVGIDVYAVTTGISASFAGLGLGGYLLGRQADRSTRPFLLYALIEAATALSGPAATITLAHFARPFAALQSHAGLLAWLPLFLLIGIPALLMGGTLPVLVRAVSASHLAITGGKLYAANTAGAIAGTLAAPFLLLPLLGVQRTAFFACALNLAAALAAFRIGRSGRFVVEAVTESSRSLPRQVRLAFLLYAIAGGIALGYEVVWSQAIVQFLSTRSFAFAIVLATYLSGLALGSFLYARFGARIRDPWTVFALLIAGAGLIALLEIAILGNWLMAWQSDLEHALRAVTGSELLAMCGRFVVAALAIVFLPTVFLGAAFPAALQLASPGGNPGRSVGSLLAVNTAGGILGTLLTGFLLIPVIGIISTLGLLAISAGVLGIAAGSRASYRKSRWVILATCLATGCSALLVPRDELARLLPSTRHGGKVIFYQESAGGTVAVLEEQMGRTLARRLYIQGVSNSGDAMASLRYMRLQALLPLLIHRHEPRSALVIGMGTGITAGALLAYPGLDRRVCAELLPAVVEAAPLFRGNLGITSDPRMRITLRDGRRELLQNSEQYDLITLEPPPPSAAGVVNLYSSDFYALARSRLAPGGILAQWWPLATQNDEDSRSLVRSFLDIFPYATLWTTELHEMMLVGSLSPLTLDVPRITARFDHPAVSAVLSEVGIRTPAAVLATWMTDRSGLERYARGFEPVTDDRPGIEYATWVRRGEFTRVLPRVLALQSEPPLVGASAEFRLQMGAERQTLLDFYSAALCAYQGDREGWARSISRVIKADPQNAYYSWISGETRP